MKLRKILNRGTLTDAQAAGCLRAVPNRLATAKKLAEIPHGTALLSSLYSQVNTVVPVEYAGRFSKTYYATRS